MAERVVLCMKWGTLYTAEYVNVLASAVRAHLPGPYRFVCLTNDPEGLAAGVETFPIPDIGLEHRHWYDGAWPKVAVLSHDLHGLRGRALFIDLDSVILGDLGDFFEVPGPLVAIDHGAWRGGPPSLMSSVFAFDLGRLGHVVDALRTDRDAIVARHGIEQVYLQAAVPDAAYWPAEWIVSFKRHLRRPLLVDRFLPPRRPPAGARFLAFHGRPRPIDLVRDGSWARFPRAGRGPVDWMRDYWLRHGGRV
jgi:hypothetical protein